ncbi:hypothetical protein PoB_007143600 [Plakobranchus ocellatus]|uniref:Uncharacterized protein n=1 Tax=Plakobranchus ocellatus TaxID=259542 RepID=A0AAV4DL78_9GAST|nr:hypothetical protein PoB_007143600 [Plakobranchus ocellatus]
MPSGGFGPVVKLRNSRTLLMSTRNYWVNGRLCYVETTERPVSSGGQQISLAGLDLLRFLFKLVARTPADRRVPAELKADSLSVVSPMFQSKRWTGSSVAD